MSGIYAPWTMPLGPTELIIILVILLLLFGAKRLPELGKSLGGGMREFKDSVTGKDDAKDSTSTAAQLEPRRDSPVQPTSQPTPEEQAPGIPSERQPPSDAG